MLNPFGSKTLHHIGKAVIFVLNERDYCTWKIYHKRVFSSAIFRRFLLEQTLIGIHDPAAGSYRWISGQLISIPDGSLFGPGQPRDVGNLTEKCCSASLNKLRPHVLCGSTCLIPRYSICEKRVSN